METVELKDGIVVLHGAVNMGLVRCDEGLVVIDSGLDKQAGKQLLKVAAQADLPICGIVNTHAHADHFGGNAYLLSAYRVPVYAPGGEAAVIRRPSFEPEYLWQGAQPLPDLQNKFLLASASPVDFELTPTIQFEIGHRLFDVIPLPGHSTDQCGIFVDGVLFAADAYFDVDVVAKHGIPYMVNYTRTLHSARAVMDVDAAWYVPGHGVPTQDPSGAVAALCTRHEAAYQTAVNRCAQAATLEDIVEAVCAAFELTPANPGAYVLLRTPVAAYVSAAVSQGHLQAVLRGGRLAFSQIDAQGGTTS